MKRRSTRTLQWVAVVLVSIVAVGAPAGVDTPIAAQDHGSSGPAIAPSGSAKFVPQIRTAADMQIVDAAIRAAGGGGASLVDESTAQKPVSRGSDSNEPTAETPPVPPLIVPTPAQMNWEGISGAEAGGNMAPSAAHGAVGHTQYVQVVNSAMRVFTKGTAISQPEVVSTVTLKALFGLPGDDETIFSPRIVYDERWRRWVLLATRRSASTADSVSKFYFAVSNTSAADEAWCTYSVTLSGGVVQNGDWLNYPQLGMDLDGLIVTGNIFTSTGTLRTAAVIPIPKAQAYNCLGVSAPRFEGLIGTLAPPLVRDTNGAAFIISAKGGVVRKYTLKDSSRATVTLSGPAVITGTAAFFGPSDAPQGGTATLLHTMDGRFINASTQVGTDLWNTHAVATVAGGVSRMRWYRINTAVNNVPQQGTLSIGGNLGDKHVFNASIAANDANSVVITYTYSSTAATPQMRFTGKQSADLTIGSGYIVAGGYRFTTPNPARWGYSAVSVDPVNQNHFWIVNQLALGPSDAGWRTRIVRVGF